jgi:protein involved in polysaccharide export with SLBB domain
VDYRAIVDRNGFINIPAVGSVSLNGVRANQAEGIIRNQIGKSFSNFQIKVTPGQIRAIRIYVVGQAQKPGTYTVSSLSTLVTAMFVTGGPGHKGSMRNVELKRAGKTIASMDLYAFIAKGDKSKDVQLLEGDTIFIPPAFGHVAIVGKVETPAVYEIKDNNESIASLLSLTGGLPVVADPLLATLQRIDPQKRPSVFSVQVKLDTEGQKQSLHNGDILTVLPISTGIPIAKRDVYVRIDGEVQKPGLYQVKFGETTQDLIQKAGGLTNQAYVFATEFYREATRIQQEEAFKRLITRLEATLKSQAATVTMNQPGAGGDAALLAQRNQAALMAAQGQLARLKAIKPEGRIALQINPNRNDAEDIPDVVLEPGDRLVIPARNDFVQVYGSVNIESSLIWRNRTTVNDYLKISGVQRSADMSSIFIIRADGTIQSEDGGVFSSISDKAIYSGDTIVVPEKFDRETGYTAFMRGLKDWTLVLAQFGLAAAAIQVFK